jgi:predicted transcriptional regulator
LGPLEARVMRALMDGGPGNVSDVARRLRPELAYTTVMTELAMLHRMGLADRQKEGRGYRYEARMKPGQLREAMAAELVTQIREDFGRYAHAAGAGSPGRKDRRKRARP